MVADAFAWRLAVAGIDAADMVIRGDVVDDAARPVPAASLGQGNCFEIKHEEKQNAAPLFHTECVVSD